MIDLQKLKRNAQSQFAHQISQQHVLELIQMIEDRDAEIADLRKDAERYRWFVSQLASVAGCEVILSMLNMLDQEVENITAEMFTAELDAAIARHGDKL